MQRAGKVTAFQSLGYPLTNWLCLLFLAGILVVMYLTPDIRISVCLIPGMAADPRRRLSAAEEKRPGAGGDERRLIANTLPGGRVIFSS